MAALRVPRPQPVGIFDGPAALVVLSEVDEELHAQLSQGRVPQHWPASARVLELALADDTRGALEELGDGPFDAVNRFVLQPTEQHLRLAHDAVGDCAELAIVLAAAAYAAGLSDELPAAAADGELSVLALTVRASQAIEVRDLALADASLEHAAAVAAEHGPALQGRALASLADVRLRKAGPTREVAESYGEAARVLIETGLDGLRADVQIQQAAILHQLSAEQPELLVEAIRLYQSALVAADERRNPEGFAFANMNLALALLTLPAGESSGQIRLGVAVQSLRAALRVYTREHDEQLWATARLNLANALQYLPSSHRQDNLAEAVEIYEELLGVRSPQTDPAGYARVLANQANALSHLGMLGPAREKCSAAREWFKRLGDEEAVATMDEQLRNIDDVSVGSGV